MADFEIVDEPKAQSQFEVVDEPQFEVEPSKSDWAAGVASVKQTPSLPAGAGIRAPKSEPSLPAGAGIRMPKAEKKPFHPGQILDYLMNPIDPEVTGMVMGGEPKPTVDSAAPFHPGQAVGRIGDAAKEIFHDLGTEAINAIQTPLNWMLSPLIGRGARVPQMEHGPYPMQGPQEMQGPKEFIGPQQRNLGTPVDLGTLRRPDRPSAQPTITELAQDSQYAPGTSQAGVFSEDMLSAPMRRSPESATQHGAADTRQKRVQRYVPDPETGLIVPFEHTPEGNTAFPLYREETTGGELPYMSRNHTDAQRAMIEKKVPYDQEFTTEFEKPGFLRTAEEKLQDKNPLRSAEDMAPTGPAQGRAFERSRRELEAAQAERDAIKARAKEILREQREAMMVPEQEWQGPPAPPKKKTEFMESPAQAGFTMDPNGNVIIGDGAFPSKWNRAVHKALDVLGRTGPIGKALQSVLYGMDDYARQATATNFADWVREIQKVYPANKRPGVLRDPRREWSVRDYINIDDKEYEALVDLWYTDGAFKDNFNKLDPAAKLRVQEAFPTWKISFGRASSDPGVQQLTVKNTVTGEEKPLGSPSSFLPHQYRGTEDTGKYSKTLMKRIYEQYRKSTPTPVTESEFRETFRKRAQGYTPVATDDGKSTKWIRTSAPKRFLGVEEARLFDAAEVAKEEGKSVLKVLQEHGLETDVVKLQLRYNLGALHRGQQKLHQQSIDKLWANWREEVGHDPVADSWATTLEERYKGQSLHEDIDRVNAEWLQKVKAINALTLLTRATVAAANQFFTYGLAKPTWRALIDRVAAPVFDRAALQHAKELIPDSGALLANFNQEMNRIDGLFGAWSMAQLRLTGFNYLDRVQRSGAAKLGYFYAKDLGRSLMKDPTSVKIRQQLTDELRLNPDEVLSSFKRTGGLSDELAKRAMQVYADTAMGTTGVRGKPLFATSSHWAPQLMLNLRGQLVSNMTEAYKMVFHAPDIKTGIDKAARLVLGAAVAGTATRAIGDALRGQLGGELQGSSKDLKKKLGDEGFAMLVDGIVYGLGTIATDTALSAIAPGDDVRWKWGSAVLGVPLTQIGKMANIYKDATKDPLRGVLRTVPFPVPLDMAAEEAGIIRPKKKR